VRTREVAAAQAEILNIARRLESDGKIVLKIEQGDDLLV
jgi:flagellar motor switch protein FliG